MSDRPHAIDVERGAIRIGIPAALTVLGVIIAATFFVAMLWSRIAEKSELEALRKAFAAQTELQSKSLQAARDLANANAAELRKRSEQLDRLAGRIDFLVEAQLEEARSSTRARKAVEKAMRKVRATARAKNATDPIADLTL